MRRYVPPSRPIPDPDQPAGPARTAFRLAHDLEEWLRHDGSPQRLRWDRAARAAVEHECAAAGRPAFFWVWWDFVTNGRWEVLTRSARAWPRGAGTGYGSLGAPSPGFLGSY